MESIGMPILQVLLLSIIFLSVLVEIKTGGMGAGVLLGLVAAGVFFGSQYVHGLVNMFHIALFLGGVLCIIVEMLLPTVGLLAGAGVVAMLYSMVLAMGGNVSAMYVMLAALLLSVAIFAFLVNKLPSSKLWKKVVLSDQSTTARGYVSTAPRLELIGRKGIVSTELRPSGTMLLDGVPVDVVSEGEFLAKGTVVRVAAVQGSRVIVRRVD